MSVAGIAADKLDSYFQPEEPLDYEKTGAAVVNVAYDVLNYKGCTNSGIAMVACRIARAVFYNENSIFPVSTTLTGEYGLSGIALSLPCVVNPEGVRAAFGSAVERNGNWQAEKPALKTWDKC